MRKINVLHLLLLLLLVTSFKSADEWYKLETKSYNVLFPKKPTSSSQEVDSQIGKLTLNLNVYEASDNEKDDNHLYLLNETAYPDSLINSDKKEMLDRFFKGSVEGMVNNVQGKIIAEKEIELSGFPGREIAIDYQSGLAVIKARVYLVKNILYMLETITDTNKQANKSIDTFLNSFHLK